MAVVDEQEEMLVPADFTVFGNHPAGPALSSSRGELDLDTQHYFMIIIYKN